VTSLKEVLANKIPTSRQIVKDRVKQYGSVIVDQITVEQIYGGMRGISCLVCDTSSVPADKGLSIRGRSIGELADRLPEEIFWLLLTNELPDAASLKTFQTDLQSRAKVPAYVWNVLDAMPAEAHPMCMLTTTVLCMEGESVFRERYDKGLLKKEDHWDATYEDAMNLIARLPAIAAAIYRKKFNKGPRIDSDPSLDWSANYVRMLGLKDATGDVASFMRLFLTLHCDHENGNVSAMTAYTVNSALSDLYYSVSAGLSGLAGPLHGLANQECLMWVQNLMKQFDGPPSKEQIRNFATETLKSGKLIPGYGHGVLRVTDPRFTALLEFGKKHCPNDPIFQTVSNVFDVLPDLLKTINKIKDPWPNIDASTGALLHHYGLTEPLYYTVIFGVSRTLGICSQAILNRSLMMPISRPKSVTSEWLETKAISELAAARAAGRIP
jgi:citrate synthase